ncbi:hypothetical protein [Streptomyces lydicus]|uniref:hypothetical protein n=1 Tax=Streptomyces lydicus TaxID=47763 RepID=UPI00379DBDB4
MTLDLAGNARGGGGERAYPQEPTGTRVVAAGRQQPRGLAMPSIHPPPGAALPCSWRTTSPVPR